MSKPRLLDLFCGAGGAAMGYHRAGFEVVGVDIEPQPNYPFEFHQDDALEYEIVGFDAVHASPPCQAYTKARNLMGNEHPNLIGPVRELLAATALPWVIENVKGAPLRNPQLLEGQMFGLNTHRPRLFETNWDYEAPFLRPPPPRQTKMGRPPRKGEAIQIVGNFSGVPAAREAMGTPWMNQQEMREAIPPAYTEHIGGYLMAELEARVAVIDPAQVMEQIDKGAEALDGGGKELGKAITEAAKTELAYKEALEKALLEVRDGYRESGERMPAEDLRLAEAHQKVNGATYAKYLTSKARVDALRAWLRALEAQVSARQSLLRALTEEARAA